LNRRSETRPAETSSEIHAWRALLARRRASDASQTGEENSSNEITTSQLAKLFQDSDQTTRRLIELYSPLVEGGRDSFVVAHLGQSLDGRIAAANGASRWITGPEDVVHNHRMRALFDAVVVGAGTICYDDPQLTVREVEGPSPVRVVIDADRRLGPGFKVFSDGEVETLLLCREEAAQSDRHGEAQVLAVAGEGEGLAPAAILERLKQEGLTRVFVEGGGVTVSRFLEAGCLDRLQIAVAPIIVGSGRPGVTLPEIDDIADALRPPVRRFALGDDVLFECSLERRHR
jgi:riboflavin-specific deaminase-like protein